MRRRVCAGRPAAVATVVAVLVAALAGALHPPVGAAAPAQQSDRGVRFELVDQDIAFSADGDLRLRFRLIGALADLAALAPPEPPPTTVPSAEPAPPEPAPPEPPLIEPPPIEPLSVVVVNYEPLTPREDPVRFIGADARTSRLRTNPIDGVLLADARDRLTFAEDGTVTLDLTVGTDRGESVEDRINFSDPGLYPIVVSLVAGDIATGDAEVVATYGTIVQRLPSTGEIVRLEPPTDLSIAVAIDEIGPDPSATERDGARQELGTALALTSAVASPVTLSIPPIVLGDEARRDQVALAEALSGDRLLSVSATPLDVSSAAGAGITDTFARQLREGEDLLTAAVPTNVARRDVWFATAPLSASGAQVIRDLGYRYVVMTPAMFAETVDDTVDDVVPATDMFVEIALPDGGTLPLLVVDGLSSELTREGTDAVLDDRTPAEWAIGTIVTVILDQERSNRVADRSRILSGPDLEALDPRLISALETFAESTPSVRFTEAGALPGVTDVQRVDGADVTVRLPDRAGPELTGRLGRLDTTAVAMLSVGSMLPADDPRPAGWSARIAELVSTGYSDDDVDAALAELIAEADALKSAVVSPEPFTFTLTGRSGNIDLRLLNTADEPLTVLVRLSSPKLSFPDGDRLVELRPNEQTLVPVPVRARTNGTSAVRVEVLTPAGESINDPVVLTSRVNALTGFGQVLTAGLILVLLSWWFSHWRARRRETSAFEAEAVIGRHPSNGK